MLTKKINIHPRETVKLRKKIVLLQQQLHTARKLIASVKAQNIDALVTTNNNVLKIYSEKTADRTYRILIEKMHEGAVMLTEEGTILYCNSSFSKMVELPLQKVIGLKFKQLIKFSKEHFDALLKRSKENGVKEEVSLFTHEGKSTPVLMSVNTLSFDDNYVLSIILTDLTIQNKNQEELKNKTKQLEHKNLELENANKDLTSFTHISSHDLQEPLRKIQTFVTSILVEEENNLSETGKELFRRMRLTAQRMQTLINDLLTYSQTKNSDRKFEETDLNLIVDEVKKDLEDVILKKNATIQVAFLCEANIIRFQFSQLINNLISNSLKFMRPAIPPRIKIESEIIRWSKSNDPRLESKKEYCHITYTDNGIGFDSQYSERIFEVFQRLHTQEEYKGTGIGLAICKRIVENHSGIIIASGKINDGARFDIYIPLIEKQD